MVSDLKFLDWGGLLNGSKFSFNGTMPAVGLIVIGFTFDTLSISCLVQISCFHLQSRVHFFDCL